MNEDVHTEHCCLEHGCKYANPRTSCTVESGEKQQSFPCEECEFDKEQLKQIMKTNAFKEWLAKQ